MKTHEHIGCGSSDHFSRRTLLKAAGVSSLSFLTPLGDLLAVKGEKEKDRQKSVIVLWLAGGPSQVETFDPHPGKPVAFGSSAIKTAVKDIQIGSGLPQTAELMNDLSIIRSVTSKEGDHERATYNMKTGYRPNPSIVHASMGSIITHELPDPSVEIPTHVSILPNQWPARGGYLGAEYDAFQVGDPKGPVSDVKLQVEPERDQRRSKNLALVERAFARGRYQDLDKEKTLHRVTMGKARRMMNSDQLKAFDVSSAPASELNPFGDTPFGRGCFAALRLVESGVRCVEVTLNGWDTHTNNHEQQGERIKVLDPALSSLIKALKVRGLYDDTVVVCGGEFGRTPILNAVDGRDHWPHGFSIALGGGGIKGGRVIGATDPAGIKEEPEDKVKVEDVHCTILTALGINPEKEVMTGVGRPMMFSEGFEIEGLLG
ncbi:MAG: hypothetical protein CMO80_21235 [Verrucomicrobiales bacterium]|nr:hypothetical protein [Verrucomicrobiales bacterium]|tara:strand:- start:3295 stop:4587 length:1293 start_codon:yes stop_codon:yes gene_type:complete